jgi:hypothetical protein
MDITKKVTRDIDTVSVTYKTTDYGQFKTLDGNRKINNAQVTRLIKAIDKKDLLHQNPILVNDKMEIIDGQHRLLVAQALGKPVYYRIESQAGLEDTILLNANNRKWSTDDYLNSYVKLGREDYIKVQEFKEAYSISTYVAVILLSGYGSRDALELFRDGKLVINDYDKSELLASTMVELRSLSRDGSWHDRDLISALDQMMSKRIDPKILLDKMKTHNIFLTRRISPKEYLVEFEEILNYQNNGQLVELV